MLSINIVCVGNLKEKFSQDSAQEYIKRLSAFCKLSVVELKEQNNLTDERLIVQKESEDILKHLKGHVVLCDISGRQVSSEDFSALIQKISLQNSCITFVIGGSYGVGQNVREAATERISFSKMTFPHNLFRIMLLEQIYRAFTISAGKSYHK